MKTLLDKRHTSFVMFCILDLNILYSKFYKLAILFVPNINLQEKIEFNEIDQPLAGPNLDLLCVQQLGAAPIHENYAKLDFDAKHLEKRLNRGEMV